jgi:hypothetical protein
VEVGGALVAEAERRMVTSRLLMLPYLTDKDLEEIAVELVSAQCWTLAILRVRMV